MNHEQPKTESAADPAPHAPAPVAPPDRQLAAPAKHAALPPPHNKSAAQKKKSHVGVWLIFLVLVLAAIAFFFLRGKKPQPPPPPPVVISVTNVQKGDIEVAITYIGSVQPVYTATISPRVDGQVLTVNYTEGQMVKSNDLLAVIDPGPYQATLTQASGQLERDTNLLAGAKIDLERYQQAYLKKAIPKQQYDDQLALVHQDEGTVKYDQGQVDSAQVQLNYCYVRAPFDGQVGLRLIDPGNVVHAANTNAIVVVAQVRPITAIFSPAEDYLPQIEEQLRAGHEMAVEAWDRSQEKKLAVGKLLAVNNLIDSGTGTIRLRAVFDNKEGELFANQFINARLVINTLHDQALIPTFAVQRNPTGAFVYVVTTVTPTNNPATNGAHARAHEHGTNSAPMTNYLGVVMRDIVTGVADGNVTAVTQGLKPGEMIALDNFNKLGDRTKVAIRGKDHGAPAEGGTNNASGGKGAGAHHRVNGSYGQNVQTNSQ